MVFEAGPSEKAQLYRLPVADLTGADPEKLTDGEAGVGQWDWAPDSKSIYFIRADSFDEAEEDRRERGLTVDIKNMVTPLSNLWAVGEHGTCIHYTGGVSALGFATPQSASSRAVANRLTPPPFE